MVTPTGCVIDNTVRELRRDAIVSYDARGYGEYADDRRTFGIQVVRCSITTEV